MVTRMLRIRKRLQQRPINHTHLGKGNAGTGRPVHTINLTATASCVPIGALQLPSQVGILAFLPLYLCHRSQRPLLMPKMLCYMYNSRHDACFYAQDSCLCICMLSQYLMHFR